MTDLSRAAANPLPKRPTTARGGLEHAHEHERERDHHDKRSAPTRK